MRFLLLSGLLAASIWLAASCGWNDRKNLLNCVDDNLPYGETLYYGDEAYYEQISRSHALEVVEQCYDDEIGPQDDPSYNGRG